MTVTTRSCIEKERQTLLVFKANLEDTDNNLYDWSEDEKDCCKWVGVRCNNHTHHVIELDLSTSYNLAGNFSPSFSLLHQLQSLNLRGINFQFNPIPNSLSSLTNLRHLDISAANLSGSIPHQLANISNLLHLDLSRNFLSGSVPVSFVKLTSLRHLDLSRNQLGGIIPKSFGNCSSLVELNLSENLLNGSVPSFAGCSSMKELILHHNVLYGEVPNFTGCSSLSKLSLAHNSLNGSISDFTGCLSLLILDLSSNRLTGNLPNSVGQLSNLQYLDVSSNSLKGLISNDHFLNLTQLAYLDFSFNSFALDLSSLVRIPSQLTTIRLQSCKLGPRFPIWIQDQSQFTHLDISSAGISDSVPAWFWDLPIGLQFLNLSSNEIKGMIPNMTSRFDRYPGMDFSNNHLKGPIPLLPSRLALDLSGNKFTGTLDFLCQIDAALTVLDLSNNLFSGSLPDCWFKFGEKLLILSLSNNHLSGEIPSSLGFLSHLEALCLRSNAFVGELPLSLSNSTKLRFVDVSENKLSGNVPVWIGERLSELYVLVLRSNRFYGSLPSQICWLNNLQFLDLSKNELSGNIPRCLYNFTAMARTGFQNDITNHSYNSYVGTLFPYELVNRPMINLFSLGNDTNANCLVNENEMKGSEQVLPIYNALVAWKGRDREFGRSVLHLLKIIDLSSNKLSGEIPNEITSLGELVSLNFSNNKLHGQVPKDMGRLKSLDSLDLSRNEFFGNIPSSMSQLTFLSYLDLSNNNLSGRIPSGPQLQRFDSSSYSGNPQLWGPPLTQKCGISPGTAFVVEEKEADEGDFWKSYYTGVGAGFAVGFWGICGAIFLNRRCRHFLFASLSHAQDWIYVTVAVHFRKLQKKLQGLRGVLHS